jgi:hypothetical protein
MKNNDERDFAEEEYNRQLLETGDGERELPMNCPLCAPFYCDDPDQQAQCVARDTPKLSKEEQDYICSLPITERTLAIYGLQTANMWYQAHFICFLRRRMA